VNTLLVAAGSATAEAPEAATSDDWLRHMSVGHRLPGGRVIVHSPAARWCDLCERQRDQPGDCAARALSPMPA
jgi:hypothetical protein